MATRKLGRKTENGSGQPKSNEYMVLRTVYLPASLDFRLRRKALAANKSKNEIIRDLLVKATG